MSGAASDVAAPGQVVVTGAAGWLGQNLVRALADRSVVRCLVRDPAEARLLELAAPNASPVVGDVRDPTTLDRLFDGMCGATVFHAAAVIHPPSGRVRELFDVNVGGTELALDRAKRAGAARFVHVSSNSPFGANASPRDRFDERSPYSPHLAYGRSKHEAELIVARAHAAGDLATVIVRPPWFYGPFQPERQTRFMAAVRRGGFPIVGDGSCRRSMVYTGNLVHGLLRAEVAAAAPGGAFWIADAQPYTMSEILATVRDAFAAEGFEVRGRLRRLPRLAGVVAERLDRALQDRGRYLQAVHVLGELKDTIACDIDHARAVLGYVPVTSLFAGMRESIRWCLARGHQL